MSTAWLSRQLRRARACVWSKQLEECRSERRLFSSSSPTDASKVQLSVNGHSVSVPVGSSLLEACRVAGFRVPTLCHHPALKNSGSCRLCLVEVENAPKKLMPACVTEAKSGMHVHTNSSLVESSVESNLMFMRARHPDDCATCEANGRCEFQDLLYRYQIDNKLPKRPRAPVPQFDRSSPALQRELDKCVLCYRCIRMCSDVQGMNILGIVGRGDKEIASTAFNLPIHDTECIACGQCSFVCPTAAIIERPHIHEVIRLLESKEKIMIAQTAPASRVTLSEEFNLAPGTVSTGRMVAALRAVGFDFVFDTNLAADLTIMEEGTEFITRLRNGGPFPQFTSCCPAWVNMVEKVYPQLIPNLSTCRSPQHMMGALVKTFFARRLGVSARDIVLVSVMPCVAKKDEAARPQLQRPRPDGGAGPDVDYVLTTREAGHLMRVLKVPFMSLPEQPYDQPLGLSTGAAELFAATGGVMEAALRMAHEELTGGKLQSVDFHQVRGLNGIREATLDIAGTEVRVAVACGGANLRTLADRVVRGEANYHFVEMMACRGGCIGGGGNPKSLDPFIIPKRVAAVYDIDKRAPLRSPQENPAVQQLYSELLGAPNSAAAHELLHTHFTDRQAPVPRDENYHIIDLSGVDELDVRHASEAAADATPAADAIPAAHAAPAADAAAPPKSPVKQPEV